MFDLSNIMSLGSSTTDQTQTSTVASSQDLSPMGLPADDTNIPPLGFDGTQAAVQSAPAISSAQSIWDKIKTDASSAIDYVESAPGKVIGAAESESNSILQNAENAVAAPLKSTYMYLLLGLVVLGGVLYFVGKGGAIGQAANFVPRG